MKKELKEQEHGGIIVFKIGSKDTPATDDDIKDFKRDIKKLKRHMKKMNFHTIVSHHAVKTEVFYT
jgi:hypothetical protein